jgi:hypothetical protein
MVAFSFVFNDIPIHIIWDGHIVICKDRRFIYGFPTTINENDYFEFYINFFIREININIQMYVVPIDVVKKEKSTTTHYIEQIIYSK